MSLVSDLISQAFQDAGVTQPGETVSSTIQSAAFAQLQQLMQSLTLRPELSFLPVHQAFSLTAGTFQYSLGTSADSGTLTCSNRPLRVTGWLSKSANFYLGGSISSFEGAHAQAKNFVGKTSVLAEIVAADTGWPLIGIEVYPVPAASPGTLELDFLTQWPAFSTVGDTVSLPPGWELMVETQLALVLGPLYARQGGIPPALTGKAEAAMAPLVARGASILQLQQGAQAQPAA